MKYIGLDAHSATCSMAVLNEEGKVTTHMKRPTAADTLIQALSRVNGPKHLAVEESSVAQWISIVLKPYVTELTVCDPRENDWISRSDHADDYKSAVKLARLLRGGYLKPVRHPGRQMARLRRMFLHYYDLNHQITRFKNKVKSFFHQAGIHPRGGAVYRREERDRWLERLTDWKGLLRRASDCLTLVDTLEEMKSGVRDRMVRAARRADAEAYRILRSVPGVGPVVATGYMAVIVTPERFSRKNKLWSYAGLANIHRESGETVSREGASNEGNKVLKWVVTQHYRSAVQASWGDGPCRFARKSARLRQKGVDRAAARRNLCRTLLSVVRGVWRKRETYRERH